MLFLKTTICIFHLKSINPQNMGGGGRSGRTWEESGVQSFEWCMEECFGLLHYLSKATEKYAPNLSWSKLLVCSTCSCIQTAAHLLVFYHNISCESLPVRDVQVWELMRRWRERKKNVCSQFFEINFKLFWEQKWSVSEDLRSEEKTGEVENETQR